MKRVARGSPGTCRAPPGCSAMRAQLLVQRFLLDPLGLRLASPRRSGRPASARRCSRDPRARWRRSARGTAAAWLRPPRPACAARASRSPSQSLASFDADELVLEVLLDVVLRQRVDDAGRERRVRRAELHVHQPAVADRRDGQVREERVDRPRLRRGLVRPPARLRRAAAGADVNRPVT